MKSLLYIFIGGGMGSLVRFALSKALNSSFPLFPLGTFLSNVLASILVGLLFAFSSNSTSRQSIIQPLLISGFCGGFSTFSTFSLENINLLKEGNYFHFALYSLLSFISCLSGIVIGIKVGNFIK